MRRKDPSITIIASGAMPDEMTDTTNARRTAGKGLAEFGTESDWTGGLLAQSWGFFDALSEHWYCHSGTRFDLETGQLSTLGTRAGFIPVEEPLVDWARRPANRVRSKAENWEEYVKRFPSIKEKGIYVSIDEWAYDSIRPSLKLNLSLPANSNLAMSGTCSTLPSMVELIRTALEMGTGVLAYEHVLRRR